MSGQQYFDILTMATGAKGPKNSTRLLADVNGNLFLSIKGAAAVGLGHMTQSSADLLSSDWHAQQFAFAISKVPQLTGWTPIPIGMTPLGAAVPIANDAGYEGGGLTSTAAATLQYLSKSMTSFPKTGRWAVAFDGQTGFPGVVTNTCFGLGDLAGTNFIDFGAFTAQDATHWVFKNQATFAVAGLADVNRHTFFIIADGTNITVYVDGVQNVQVAQGGANGVSVDAAYCPFIIGDAGALKLARCGFGFV